MKLMSKRVVLATALFLPLSTSVFALDEQCPGGAAPVMGPNGVECPATELPEPSSAWLFLAAAGVAAAARTLRKKK